MAKGIEIRAAHFPGRAPVEAYGNGGFRFADMSHRGSILCLPSGIYGWEASAEQPFQGERLLKVFEESDDIRFLLFGTGREIRRLPPALADRLRQAGISCDPMSTGAAVRTFNIMLSEGRPVAAALVAVD
ncbi:MAG TPA: Mth938-like domain-containing protein [Aurantimonas sp.]|nr:Mth938-like domain-containing protein [Aurantimonas sp.]